MTLYIYKIYEGGAPGPSSILKVSYGQEDFWTRSRPKLDLIRTRNPLLQIKAGSEPGQKQVQITQRISWGYSLEIASQGQKQPLRLKITLDGLALKGIIRTLFKNRTLENKNNLWGKKYHSFQNHYTHEIIIFELFRGLQLQLSGVFRINEHYSYSFFVFPRECSYRN